MKRVVARRRSGYTHDVEIEGGHTLVTDEPEEKGGTNLGPSPVRTLGAALASCIAITMEMYADRKGWDLGAITVTADIHYDGEAPERFAVDLGLPDGLDDDQVKRLRRVAGKCPVHRSISVPVDIA